MVKRCIGQLIEKFAVNRVMCQQTIG